MRYYITTSPVWKPDDATVLVARVGTSRPERAVGPYGAPVDVCTIDVRTDTDYGGDVTDQVAYALSPGCTRRHAEAVAARVANSGLVPGLFRAMTEPRSTRALRSGDDGINHVADVIARAGWLVDLPDPWTRFRVHAGHTLVHRIWDGDDARELLDHVSNNGREPAAVWPWGVPSEVEIANPTAYLDMVADDYFREQPPLPRRDVVAALHRDGALRGHVTTLARIYGCDRSAIYYDRDRVDGAATGPLDDSPTGEQQQRRAGA